jgi:DNA polymerase-3 subunit epsilon
MGSVVGEIIEDPLFAVKISGGVYRSEKVAMPGAPTKITCHQYADRIRTSAGLRAHTKALSAKHGHGYVDDWIAVHMAETRWARKLLRHRKFTCMDTETTSTDRVAEMTEIGVVDGKGAPLIETLIKPLGPIKAAARRITGITEDDVKDAPALADVYDSIQAALLAHPVMLIYNSEFDVRILKQSTFQAGLPEFKLPQVEDLMLRFARWVGVWNPRRDDYAWHRLGGLHRAIGDCRAMVGLMEKMGRAPVTMDEMYWEAR